MKKKHYIKTVEDIKYCEEHKIVVRDDVHQKNGYYNFDGSVWSFYWKGKLLTYNARLFKSDGLYYYEEESEEQQEASEKDIGKLCWFFDKDTFKVVGILKEVLLKDDCVPFRSDYGISSTHCRPLTKEEIKKFMEKAE